MSASATQERRRTKEITGQKYNGLPYYIGRPKRLYRKFKFDVYCTGFAWHAKLVYTVQLAEVRSRPKSRTSDHRAERSDQANVITRGRTDHFSDIFSRP